MIRRFDHLVDQEHATDDQNQRLEALAEFQISALNHALACKNLFVQPYIPMFAMDAKNTVSGFVVPKVKKVVYSTCSIHEIENERVAQKALLHHPEFDLISIMSDWPRRGLSSPDFPKGKNH
jgi:25S rRNA (cytosine2278-C5)-methyltransferase